MKKIIEHPLLFVLGIVMFGIFVVVNSAINKIENAVWKTAAKIDKP